MASIATAAAAGRAFVVPEAIAGHRVGWFPAAGVIFAEGHPGGDELGAPAALPGAFGRLERELLAVDVPLPAGVAGEDWLGDESFGFAGVRRLDATVNLRTGSAGEGAAIMAGVAALLGQYGVQELWRRSGRLETVYVRAVHSGRVLGRWYDKGAESGLARVGELLRAEDQRRWPQAVRRGVEELHGAYVRGLFHRRFVPLYKAAKGVTVSGPIVIAQKLVEAVDAGEVTMQQAERLMGFSMLEAIAGASPARAESDEAYGARLAPERDDEGVRVLVGGDKRRLSRATRYRRRAELQALGLVLADGVLEEVEVDLGDVLEACLDCEGWERQG
jgi:hypothetical protein